LFLCLFTSYFNTISYPDHMPLLVKAGEVFYDEPSITAPLLKFMSDLVYNKSGRITFAPSSPNGILLFREASKLLVAYGTPSIPNDC
jgi:exportin-7